MNLAGLLDENAVRRPETVALIDGRVGRERRTTYHRLGELAAATAERLSAAGIGEGSRVIVLVPMRAELYATMIALWRIGAVAVFMDPSAGRRHLADCCGQAEPDALIGIRKARLLVWTQPGLRRIRKRFYWGAQLAFDAEPRGNRLPCERISDQAAILSFTSGSTGRPKCAVRSHRVLFAQFEALRGVIDLVPGECDLATMPVIALANLAAGLTTLIPDVDLRHPGRIDPAPLFRQIKQWKPARCGASPAFLLAICEEARRRSIQMPDFRKIHTGGAPVFPRSLREFSGTFVNASINVLYGSTEAEPVSHVSLREISGGDLEQMRRGRGLLVGAVSGGTELRILADRWGEPYPAMAKEDFEALALPDGSVGEIVVSGAHVVPGYLNGIGDAGNKIKVDGVVWHRTGDAGSMDEAGRLWLAGRCSAKMRIDGKTVYPFSIECAAVETLDVALAGCLPTETGYLLAIPGTGRKVRPDEIAKDIPRPERVVQLRDFPVDKRHNAKIDYQALKRRV
ncbi:MAG: AMP-binding protein [Puniceicoccaceae bacterium]